MHNLGSSLRYENVGVRGEQTISRLLALAWKDVLPELAVSGIPQLLRQQLEAHLGRVFPGFRIQLESVKNTNVATLGFSTDDGIGFVRPQNIGFGISCLLPVYVACLSADKGNVVLVENPEAHLHPAAQSEVGVFLARAAAAGVQIIVETHSDHLLNGVRRTVKSKEYKISAKDVAVYFFAGLSPEGKPHILLILHNRRKAQSIPPDRYCIAVSSGRLGVAVRVRH